MLEMVIQRLGFFPVEKQFTQEMFLQSEPQAYILCIAFNCFRCLFMAMQLFQTLHILKVKINEKQDISLGDTTKVRNQYKYISHKLLSNSSNYFSIFPKNSNNQNLTNVHMNHPDPSPMGQRMLLFLRELNMIY